MTNIKNSSESDIAKVVNELNNILESSSLDCVETTSSTTTLAEQDNYSVSLLSSIDTESNNTAKNSPEESNSVASLEVQKIHEFSGDFWSEPFISEDIYSEYYCPNISEGDIFSYEGGLLFF